RGQIEPHAARHERADDEQPDIVAGEARRDRDDLVGDRRDAFDQDDRRAPARIGLAKSLDLVAVTVQRDEPVADGVVEIGADHIAEHAARDRRDGAQRRVRPGLLGYVIGAYLYDT